MSVADESRGEEDENGGAEIKGRVDGEEEESGVSLCCCNRRGAGTQGSTSSVIGSRGPCSCLPGRNVSLGGAAEWNERGREDESKEGGREGGGLSLVAASGGHSSLQYVGLSLSSHNSVQEAPTGPDRKSTRLNSSH